MGVCGSRLDIFSVMLCCKLHGQLVVWGFISLLKVYVLYFCFVFLYLFLILNEDVGCGSDFVGLLSCIVCSV